MTDSHDRMTRREGRGEEGRPGEGMEWENRKRIEWIGVGGPVGRVDNCDFHRGGGWVGRGATLHPKIFNIFFCDIRLLIE